MKSSFFEFIANYVASDQIAKWCEQLHQETPFSFKITKERSSKLGDYRYKRVSRVKKHEITINHNLNKHQFLFTFLHEVAHRITMEQYGRNVMPHGKEWKMIFSELLNSALLKGFFPEILFASISKHAKNPKASCIADHKLYKLFKSFDENKKNVVHLCDIKLNSLFLLGNEYYRKLEVRRTRSLCKNVRNSKKYLVSEIAEVKKVNENDQS